MIFHLIQLSTMNRFWMLGSLMVGASIALLRNINVTIDLFDHGIRQGIKERYIMFGSPVDPSPRLRRALQEDNSHLNYRFIYYDEESLSRERALLRDEDPDVLLATNDLFKRVGEILKSPLPIKSVASLPESEYLPKEVADMQRNTTLLGLAYFFTGEDEYAERATYLVRRWFLLSETKIEPKHLYNSPLRFQLHALLDSLQMVLGHLQDSEIIQLQRWFLHYLEYTDNHFISKSFTQHTSWLYFDVEQFALSNFVGDEGRQAEVFKRVLIRLSHQIEKDGSLPEALAQKEECDNSQMLAVQGLWTLGRLFSNSLGETLWTAEGGAMCRASEYAVPYFRDRPKCGSSTENDQRWWPIIVDSLHYCPELQSNAPEWRDWMSPNSREIPFSRYEMPRVFDDNSRIPLFWNLGMPSEKEETDEPDTVPPPRDAGTYIPDELLKAAEHDSQMAQRVNRIRRWHEVGQTDIADRMTKKALIDLRSTSSTSPNKDYIPAAMLEAAKTDKAMDERIDRIRRWHSLSQQSIVERMIKKSMNELKQKPEEKSALAQEQISEAKKSKIQDSSSREKTDKPQLTSSMDIPNIILEQAETDAELAKRIHRIYRWKRLGKHEIANKMIKKMLASTEDQTF